ncbi:site-specific integrase [Streptomyces sp. TBY4]|uniref:tyrosine-type recombinase/integrase n=1 Tax=Streptomyces sp. TBY4 TaxID=2962030 RepID=UPI0020B82EF6|nr:site-specific integrase [Streptomyces sp. TBY4]MCP3756972.1 site-specific integrase [Streptomyces sp. TBY4]
MGSNGRYSGAALDFAVPVHSEGRWDGGSAVADLAGEFGAELVRAIRVGMAQGSTAAHTPRGSSQLSWYAFATEYARAHWPGRAAKTRDETSDGLTAVTLAMFWDLPGRPNERLLRRALRHWAFVVPGPGQQMGPPAEDRLVLQWVAKASRPLVDLHDPILARDVLESLRRKLDGGEAAVETMRRKRKVLVHALGYAMERGELGSNPLAQVRWRVPKPAVSVDPRVVANPYQARDLLTAISYVGGYRRARGRRLVGLFAGMYYAGLRPEEAIAVALPDCRLPRTGWGRLIVHRTLPQAGKRWTDTGLYHDERGLKNRPPGETRVVPLPPHLVALWRESVTTFGTADDGRLFFSERGGILSYTAYHYVWREARALALSPALASTPLAKRPYDLRHSALSTWLCAGADPAEVAQRAGNSVEVLLTRYAKCLYDRQSINNQRIEGLLSAYDRPADLDE